MSSIVLLSCLTVLHCQELGATSYRDRAAATRVLSTLMPHSWSSLEVTAKSSDAEVSYRATRLIMVYPNREVKRLLGPVPVWCDMLPEPHNSYSQSHLVMSPNGACPAHWGKWPEYRRASQCYLSTLLKKPKDSPTVSGIIAAGLEREYQWIRDNGVRQGVPIGEIQRLRRLRGDLLEKP